MKLALRAEPRREEATIDARARTESREPTGPTGAPDFSFVVPAYDESRRLARTLPIILDRVPRLVGDRRVEILVVDDGSSDATAATAARLLDGCPGRVVSYPTNRGKGYALMRGMLAARGSIRLFSDADLSTPLDEIPRFLAAHEAGADIVIGSRKRPGANVERRQPLLREAMGRAFTALANVLVLSGVSDFTCGFKSFTAPAAERIFPDLTAWDWSFDVEALWLARKHGFRIREVPVTWRNDPQTKVHLRSDILRTLAGLTRIIRRKHSPAR